MRLDGSYLGLAPVVTVNSDDAVVGEHAWPYRLDASGGVLVNEQP